MIVFTATLSLIIAAVVACAGIAASSGSTHSLGDHFALSGHRLSSLSAGRLFLCGMVVRIAGPPGFSMLPGASTRCLASPGSRRAVGGIRHETTAPRPGSDRLAGEPSQPSRVDVPRPGRGLARCRGSEANIMIVSGSATRTGSAGVQVVAERSFAGVLHRVSRPVITMASRAQGVITRDNVWTSVPAVARNRVTGSVNAGHRNRNGPRWTGPESGEIPAASEMPPARCPQQEGRR